MLPFHRLYNMGLRALPMGAKLMLTFAMGKLFSLEEIGLYGLSLAVVSVATVVLGQDLSYTVIREIVTAEKSAAFKKIRDETVWHIGNYIIFFPVIFFLSKFIFHLSGFLFPIILYIVIVMEGIGTIYYYNMISFDQQKEANIAFFFRSGLWVIPTIPVIYFFPSTRNTNTLLIGWAIGSAAGIAWTAYVWRPHLKIFFTNSKVDWQWIITSLKKVYPVWIGLACLTAGGFADRFVIERLLDLESVGIITFFSTFSNSLIPLSQSGAAFYYLPPLVRSVSSPEKGEFHRLKAEAIKACWRLSFMLGVSISIGTIIIVYVVGRRELLENCWVLAALILAAVLRSVAEIYNSILFALHRDGAIWLGNTLFMAVSLVANLILTRLFGLYGAASAGCVTALFILLWRMNYSERT